MSDLNVAVVGSRDWPDLSRVRRYVYALVAKHPTVCLVSGGARGVDITAEEAALRCGARVYSFRPKKRSDGKYEIELWDRTWRGDEIKPCADGKLYSRFGQAAHARNVKIVQHSNKVAAFNAGTSGTSDTVKIAHGFNTPTYEYGPESSTDGSATEPALLSAGDTEKDLSATKGKAS